MGKEQHFVIAGYNLATEQWELADTCETMLQESEWCDFALCDILHDWILRNCDQVPGSASMWLLPAEAIASLRETCTKVSGKFAGADTQDPDWRADDVDQLDDLLPEPNSTYDSAYVRVVERMLNACNVMRSLVPVSPAEKAPISINELAAVRLEVKRLEKLKLQRAKYMQKILQHGPVLGTELLAKMDEWDKKHKYSADGDPFQSTGVDQDKKYSKLSWAYVVFY